MLICPDSGCNIRPNPTFSCLDIWPWTVVVRGAFLRVAHEGALVKSIDLACRVSRQRKAYGEGGSFVDDTGDLDASAEELHQVFNDGEAKTRASHFS